MITYRIKDWLRNYENNRTRDIKDLQWVPVRNKHDGEGFLTIMSEKDGIVIYGCWHLILQVASKSHPRGTLLRDDGTPHTAKSIALKSGWRVEKDIQRALDFCASSQVGWLEALTEEGATIPHPPAGIPHPVAANGRKGMEGREGREGNGTPPPQGVQPKDDQGFISEIKALYTWLDVDREITKMRAWFLTPKGKGRKLTRRFMVNWLNKIDNPLDAMNTQPAKLTISDPALLDYANQLWIAKRDKASGEVFAAIKRKVCQGFGDQWYAAVQEEAKAIEKRETGMVLR